LPSRAGMTEIRATRRRQARGLRYLNVAGGRPPGVSVSATGWVAIAPPLCYTHGCTCTRSMQPVSEIARMRAMLIGSVPLKTLLALTGINRETLKSDRLRGYSVAAFGAARSVVDERCLLVDAIAMLIHNDLSGTLHRRAASVVVRGFWDKWAEALARIEHKNEPVLFAIGQSSETVWWAGSGLARELPLFVANQPPMQRLLTVNIARHKCNMEQRAEKLGIGLSTGWFILPPDDPRFVSWMAEFRRDRERRQEMFDPLHMKPPHSPSARLRKSVEEATCRLQ
jgi:hypothetical protein